MAKNFNELRAKMSPESRARSDAKAKEMLAEINNQPISRIVERLAKECLRYSSDEGASLNRAQAEKILAEEFTRERERRFLRCLNTSSSHTTACSIWGDDGQGHTVENFPTPLPCNCGALENFQRERANTADAELSRVRGLLQRMNDHFLARPQEIADLRKDHDEDCDQQVGWSIGCSCFMRGLIAEVKAALAGDSLRQEFPVSAFVHAIESRHGRCCGDNLDISASELEEELSRYLMTMLAESSLSSPPSECDCGAKGVCRKCFDKLRPRCLACGIIGKHLCAYAPLSSESSAPQKLRKLRAEGWMVAVHNDYRLNGELFTFWLLTKGDRFIKGEGRTDEEALMAAQPSGDSTQPAKEKE